MANQALSSLFTLVAVDCSGSIWELLVETETIRNNFELLLFFQRRWKNVDELQKEWVIDVKKK